uniref:Uncharacterized protein n=1 Tax=Physcomitrium patens TaxID=3218 RepID=A0A2K1K2F9_PHYPA|nr:hypothetical protein PHYPA_012437 [Physcomitrium patens]
MQDDALGSFCTQRLGIQCIIFSTQPHRMDDSTSLYVSVFSIVPTTPEPPPPTLLFFSTPFAALGCSLHPSCESTLVEPMCVCPPHTCFHIQHTCFHIQHTCSLLAAAVCIFLMGYTLVSTYILHKSKSEFMMHQMVVVWLVKGTKMKTLRRV